MKFLYDNLSFIPTDIENADAAVIVLDSNEEIMKVCHYKNKLEHETIEFISLNHKTDMTLLYFILNVVEKLGFCKWYEFDACSLLAKRARTYTINGYTITVNDRVNIENKETNSLVKIELHGGYEYNINLETILKALTNIYNTKYNFIPNIYAYLYSNDSEYVCAEFNEGVFDPEEWYNYAIYEMIGLKDRDTKDYALKYYLHESTIMEICSEEVTEGRE